jgi:hypothetical protein
MLPIRHMTRQGTSFAHPTPRFMPSLVIAQKLRAQNYSVCSTLLSLNSALNREDEKSGLT